MKGFQATAEASSPPPPPPTQKKAETSIASFFSFFVSPSWIRINPDPDPKKIDDEVRRQLGQSNMPEAKKKGWGRVNYIRDIIHYSQGHEY
jgi:hypothetical protein